MKITILCGNYYPNFSAVGLCAARIAEYLAQTNDVTVLSVTDNTDSKQDLMNNGVHILKCVPSLEKKRKQSREKFKKFAFLNEFISRFYKLRRMLSVVLGKYSIRSDYMKAYAKLLKKVPDTDAIIAFCMPVEAVYAASKFKTVTNKNIKLLYMLYDGFADARTTHYFKTNKKIKFKAHISLEKQILNCADKIFYVHQNDEHLHKYHPEFLFKSEEIEHPSVVQIKDSECSKENIFDFEKTHFVYGGGLKRNYIDPSYFIKLLSSFPDFKLHIYTNDAAITQFEDIQKAYQNYVEFKPWVPADKMGCILTSANFLVNFATSDGHQISSKIFDYISRGKPIIHFYKAEHDGNLVYLRKYPLALCINENMPLEENVEIIKNWCRNNKYAHLNFEEVSATFEDCTPQFIGNRMLSELLYEK